MPPPVEGGTIRDDIQALSFCYVEHRLNRDRYTALVETIELRDQWFDEQRKAASEVQEEQPRQRRFWEIF